MYFFNTIYYKLIGMKEKEREIERECLDKKIKVLLEGQKKIPLVDFMLSEEQKSKLTEAIKTPILTVPAVQTCDKYTNTESIIQEKLKQDPDFILKVISEMGTIIPGFIIEFGNAISTPPN